MRIGLGWLANLCSDNSQFQTAAVRNICVRIRLMEFLVRYSSSYGQTAPHHLQTQALGKAQLLSPESAPAPPTNQRCSGVPQCGSYYSFLGILWHGSGAILDIWVRQWGVV